MNKNTKIGLTFVTILLAVGIVGGGTYFYLKSGNEMGESNNKIADHNAYKKLKDFKDKAKEDKEKKAALEKIDCSIKNEKKYELFDEYFTVIKENQEEAKQFTTVDVDSKNKILSILQEIVCHAFGITKKDGKISMISYEKAIIKGNEEYEKLEKDKKINELKKKVSADILKELKEFLTDGEKNKIYKAYEEKNNEIQKKEDDESKKDEDKKKND